MWGRIHTFDIPLISFSAICDSPACAGAGVALLRRNCVSVRGHMIEGILELDVQRAAPWPPSS
jgi:hypothetical protein